MKAQINTVVKGLASKEAEITLFQPTNALIISEYAPNLARINRIIDALDQPGAEDELQIVQIQHATASEIASRLTEIFELQKPGAPTSPHKRSDKTPPPAGGAPSIRWRESRGSLPPSRPPRRR